MEGNIVSLHGALIPKSLKFSPLSRPECAMRRCRGIKSSRPSSVLRTPRDNGAIARQVGQLHFHGHLPRASAIAIRNNVTVIRGIMQSTRVTRSLFRRWPRMKMPSRDSGARCSTPRMQAQSASGARRAQEFPRSTASRLRIETRSKSHRWNLGVESERGGCSNHDHAVILFEKRAPEAPDRQNHLSAQK